MTIKCQEQLGGIEVVTIVLFVCVCVIVFVLSCSNIPNRSTFVCPFCGARNLDQQELVKHCMDNHRNDPNKVVRDIFITCLNDPNSMLAVTFEALVLLQCQAFKQLPCS